jgi:hypothetical protein
MTEQSLCVYVSGPFMYNVMATGAEQARVAVVCFNDTNPIVLV